MNERFSWAKPKKIYRDNSLVPHNRNKTGWAATYIKRTKHVTAKKPFGKQMCCSIYISYTQQTETLGASESSLRMSKTNGSNSQRRDQTGVS